MKSKHLARYMPPAVRSVGPNTCRVWVYDLPTAHIVESWEETEPITWEADEGPVLREYLVSLPVRIVRERFPRRRSPKSPFLKQAGSLSHLVKRGES